MTVFAGLDLAWTAHRETGICIFERNGEGLRLLALECARVEPLALAGRLAVQGPDTVVAVDAPLIIGPQRTAERQLARVFGRYHASAYTATPAFLARYDALAGPRLAASLAAQGFSLRPSSAALPGRSAIEVYPHAAHVVLFGLDHIIRYKKGRLAARTEGLGIYREHLAAFLCKLPLSPLDPMLATLLSRPLTGLSGRDMKRIEDMLDAITCALVALRAREAPTTVFGCDEHGHIVVPGLPPGAVLPPALCRACGAAE